MTESNDKLNRKIYAQHLIIINLKSRLDRANRELDMRKRARFHNVRVLDI